MTCTVEVYTSGDQACSAREKSGEEVRVQAGPRAVAGCRCYEMIICVVGSPPKPVVLLANLDNAQHVYDELEGGRGVFAHECGHV